MIQYLGLMSSESVGKTDSSRALESFLVVRLDQLALVQGFLLLDQLACPLVDSDVTVYLPCFSTFTTKQSLILSIDTDACKGMENMVNYLEHVQSFITLKASRRGDVTLYLLSPMNTT